MNDLPEAYRSFQNDFPDVWAAYDALGAACHGQGPLDTKTRQLVKLGMATALRSEGAVHSHARKALQAGATADEVRHVLLLAVPTIGFPATVAAMTWAHDVLAAQDLA
jgi:AhpD family alkylhydroperoxidase